MKPKWQAIREPYLTGWRLEHALCAVEVIAIYPGVYAVYEHKEGCVCHTGTPPETFPTAWEARAYARTALARLAQDEEYL